MAFLLGLALAAPAATGPVVVEPPEVSAEDAWLAEAVADELPRALRALGVPALESYDRLRVLERLGLPPARLSRASVIRAAEAVAAFRLVRSELAREGETVTVKVRLLDVPRGVLAAPLLARGPLPSLPSLLASLAFDIALAGATPPERSREVLIALRSEVPFEAWRTHAQALAAPDGATRSRLLRRALGHDPRYDEAWLDLARLQLDERDYAAALEGLARRGREGIEGRDHRTERAARFAEGIALLGLGRYAEAAALYAELRRSQPTPAALANEGAALLRLGQPGRPASAPLREALEREPASLDLPVGLGFALLHEGEPKAAAFFLRAAERRDPGDAAARLLLTWALRSAGREVEAEEEWKSLQSLTSAFAGLRAPDLQRRFERILPSEGAVVVDHESKGAGELVASRLARGESLLKGGDAMAASVELQEAVALAPFNADAHALQARSLRARGEVARAEEALRASLYCRDEPSVRMELADLLLAQGRGEEARAEAARVLRREPGHAGARKLLGPEIP
jgi:Tfp pilus assembly protein PilF